MLTRPGPALTASSLVAYVEPILRRVAPITAIRFDQRWPSHGHGVVLDFFSVTVPIPQLPQAVPSALIVTFERGYTPDPWTEQCLERVACLVGVCLRTACAEPGLAGPPTVTMAHADRLLGASPAMAMVRERATRYAATDHPVLILGESGTGKELIAHAIHAQSRRRRGPFLGVNCAALVATLLEAELFGIEDGTATGVRGRKGKFEVARGGTLFLDEVADLSPQGQASLLRVLQERTLERVGGHRPIDVDVRIVAATNRPMAPLVADHQFRRDLFYRLCVLPLQVPPLRERGSDVVELTRAFLDRDPRPWHWELRQDAIAALLACEWPGNVRQLQSVVHLIRAIAPSPVIDLALVETALADLELMVRPQAASSALTAKEVAARHALDVLLACGGNKTRACECLRISSKTLRGYLRLLHDAARAEWRRRAA